MNVLILAHIPHNEIGGHTVTATQLANSFANNHHNTFILINDKTPALSNLSKKVTLINDKWTQKATGYFLRSVDIHNIFNKYKIDIAVAVDKISSYHASMPAAYNKVPLVPIIPGGSKNALKHPPLKSRKIIVFSKENKHVLVNKWNFKPIDILVKNSRFSFSSETMENYPNVQQFKVAYISSLRVGKFKAFTHFIDEASKANIQNLTIDVLGDGHDINIFKEYASGKLVTNLSFKGYSDINLSTMNIYNLVVTQGRGVIESAGMSIPVAICGENGYKGLLFDKDVDLFETTNFTGRGIDSNGNFNHDVSFLKKNGFLHAIELAKRIRHDFDIEHLREEIINITNNFNMIPSNGSTLNSILQNVKVLLKA